MSNTFNEQKAIGMALQEAAKFFQQYGYLVRVTRKNGSACIVTRDYRPDRINVAIQDGTVTEIRGVG